MGNIIRGQFQDAAGNVHHFQTDSDSVYMRDGQTVEEAVQAALSNGGFVVSATAPEETEKLWVDTSIGAVLKYYDGTAWKALSAAWGGG